MDRITSHSLLLFLSSLLLFISSELIQTEASHVTTPGFSDSGDNGLTNPSSPPQPVTPQKYDQNNYPPPSSDILHSSSQIPIIPPPAVDPAVPVSPQLPIEDPATTYHAYPDPLNDPSVGFESPPFGQGINNGGGFGQGINNGGGFGQGNNNGGGFGQGINNGGGFGQGINNGGAFGQQQGGYGAYGQYGDYGSGFLIRSGVKEIMLVFMGVLFVFWA